MEGASAVALAVILLAGGGVTGVVIMTDGGSWVHGHDGGMTGASPAEPLPYGGGDYPEGCIRGEGGNPQECDLDSRGCEYQDDPDYVPGSGCC